MFVDVGVADALVVLQYRNGGLLDHRSDKTLASPWNDEVDVFVCVWSPEYLKEMLYMSKKVGDTKNYTGKITEIIDEFNVEVRIDQKRKKFKIGLEEISTR